MWYVSAEISAKLWRFLPVFMPDQKKFYSAVVVLKKTPFSHVCVIIFQCHGPSNRLINILYICQPISQHDFFCKFQLGKQEDAEEFLSCILDGMHEEMSAAVNLNTNNVDTQGRFNFVVNLSLYEFIQVQWKFVAY